MSLPARLDEVERLTGWLRAITASVLQEDDFILLEIGVVELVNNIIEHAFENLSGSIEVGCALDGKRVTLNFSDAGLAMPDGIQERYDNATDDVALDATSGRGLGIIKRCFEQVRFYRADGLNRISATYVPG